MSSTRTRSKKTSEKTKPDKIKSTASTAPPKNKIGKELPTETREKQSSIKEYFPVRRSSRRCKSVIEDEELRRKKEKLLSKEEDGLKVIEVEGKGRGVVSTRPFTKGELVCEYSGELIPQEEARRREDEYAEDPDVGCYMYYFEYKGKRWCVDATKDNKRMGRLLNHSRTEPNVYTKVIPIDDRPFLCLLAARDIAIGEQLEYDYGERSKSVMESHPWLST